MKKCFNFTYLLFSTSLLVVSANSYAQANLEIRPFLAALKSGVAYGVLPSNRYTEDVARRIQAKTGSNGEITVSAVRVLRFSEQPNCGRVSFGLYQESTKTFWGQFGGQINICEDGSPPLRMCKQSPSRLVAVDATCADNSRPIDTPEVESAINDAVAKGGLTGTQIHNLLVAQQKSKKTTIDVGGPNAK